MILDSPKIKVIALRRKKTCGKAYSRWVDAICRDAIDTELEGVSKEDRRLDEEDRGDHGAKRG
jgi:hypothetical protein